MTNGRRTFLLGIGGMVALPGVVSAQRAERMHRLCWVSGAAPRTESYNAVFTAQLVKLGFVEGKNLTIEFGNVGGRVERFPEVVADLARRGCDAFLSTGSEASLIAVKNATKDTPIVMVAIDYDPLERGHIASLARPGGRITGVHQLQTALAEKRVEVLRELLPRARRIGVLSDTLTADTLKATRGAAQRLGFELVVHEFRSAPYDYDAAFADFARAKAEAFLPLPSGFFVPARKRIPELALQHRLPGIFNNPLWVEAGGLLSYGTNLVDMFSRAAEKMAKVLSGAKPADIPVEQPTVVEMVINMKTAKAIGVTMPQGIWFRAERVIE